MNVSAKLYHNMEYDLFLRCLTEAQNFIDETEFVFLDNFDLGDCIIGYIPYLEVKGKTKKLDLPYWVGYGCDIKNGMGFDSAETLLHAEVFGGRSIFQAWEQVCVLHLGMVPLEVWFDSCQFKDDIIEENGIWKLCPEKCFSATTSVQTMYSAKHGFNNWRMYGYTLSMSAGLRVFQKACSTLEQNGFTKIGKAHEDIDGSLIQDYCFDNMKTRIECDIEVGTVFVNSQINLIEILKGIAE